jgi:hypothetical protein
MRKRPHLFALAAAGTLAAPRAAGANDMGGLAYVVFIWPIGLLMLVLAIILSVIGFRILKRTSAEHPHGAYALLLMGVGCLIGVAYPVVTIALDRAFDVVSSLELMLGSMIPVILAAVFLFLLGRAIRRRARPPSA